MKVTSFGTSVEKLLKILFKLISIEKVFNLGRTKYFVRNGLIFRRVGIYCKGSGRFNLNFLCIQSSKITKNIWPHWKYFECGQFFFELVEFVKKRIKVEMVLTLRSRVQYGRFVVEILLALKRIVSFSAPKMMASSNNMANG